MPYLGKQSEQVGVSIQKYEFLQATDTSSGTTSFSVPSDAGDHVNVWLNGVLLVEGGSNDYTTTNTTVVFGTAPADGDIIRIDVVESFALPDALKSSGDTMTGALKLDGGIKQQTSADLSGTYAYHQLMLSDAFTVAGDVTISDNLVLAKLSDDSNAITISNDTSTRTITGTGSLEASTLAQTPNASLTGMTGEIGSAVTGSPNLNLSNATFPSGHLLKVSTVYKISDQDESGDTNFKNIFNTADHVCHGGSGNNTTIYPFFDVAMYGRNDSYRDARKVMHVTYTGVTHSPTVTSHEYTLGMYLAFTDAATREFMWLQTIPLPHVTISASGTLSVKIEMKNAHTNGRFIVYGNSTFESRIRFMEVQ